MYSPKIAEDLIPVLYQIRKRTKVPMTKIVDDILRSALRPEPGAKPSRHQHEDPSH